ncbi:hypothetical protein [Allokutzneria sp. NRRL B-24872]|uniref:hypothetical protein n=1 Tax=Allokutzneria sp. NRRL B-24872 TaxID=1137961 RepID=UPI001FEEDCA5|nr:hypothetical protein [Allokutzneria sp. NRRL B-24872]
MATAVVEMARDGRFADIEQLFAPSLWKGVLAPPAAPWKPPRCARPRKNAEHEVMIGSDALAVPGTITAPRRRGRSTGT